MTFNWEATKAEILSQLVGMAQKLVGNVTDSVRTDLADLAEWAVEAIATKNTKLLDSVQGQLQLVAQKQILLAREALQEKLGEILGNAIRIGISMLA